MRRTAIVVLFALSTLGALVSPLLANTVAAQQQQATPVVEVTPLPTKASEVPTSLHPLWKAEVGLNKAVAREFCLKPAAQSIIKMNLASGQPLSGAVHAWFQVSRGVNPMVLSAAQDYVAAYTTATKSGAAPEWAYPLAANGGVAVDKVIEGLSQAQYKGCDQGIYGQHA